MFNWMKLKPKAPPIQYPLIKELDGMFYIEVSKGMFLRKVDKTEPDLYNYDTAYEIMNACCHKTMEEVAATLAKKAKSDEWQRRQQAEIDKRIDFAKRIGCKT